MRRGEYFRFLAGHYRRVQPCKTYKSRRAGVVGTQLLHRQRAERALGKSLPRKAVVHHLDGSRSADGPIVICPSQAYHGLLHVRMRVREHGGDPNTDRICVYCHDVKPITAFVKFTARPNVWHCLECSNRLAKARKARRITS
jgi:hypothetical protein